VANVDDGCSQRQSSTPPLPPPLTHRVGIQHDGGFTPARIQSQKISPQTVLSLASVQISLLLLIWENDSCPTLAEQMDDYWCNKTARN